MKWNGPAIILGNGAGLVMATLDLVTDAGSKPAMSPNGRNTDIT